MKKLCLKVLAKAAEINVKNADGGVSRHWTYEPKAPANVKEFLKNK